jgi:DNA-binding transcriptional ArsR family regulator
MLEVDVIDDPAGAAMLLDPIRTRLLAELAEPASAAALGARVGLARQKVNYHLRALEAHGLIRVAEEKTWGGLTERRMVATAASYVVSPGALGALGPDLARGRDQLSAGYLIALAARLLREVGGLWRQARGQGKRLATLGVDAEIRFRSPADRADFTRDLTAAISTLVARYHDADAGDGRSYRLLVAAHPLPRERSQPCP